MGGKASGVPRHWRWFGACCTFSEDKEILLGWCTLTWSSLNLSSAGNRSTTVSYNIDSSKPSLSTFFSILATMTTMDVTETTTWKPCVPLRDLTHFNFSIWGRWKMLLWAIIPVLQAYRAGFESQPPIQKAERDWCLYNPNTVGVETSRSRKITG